MSEVWAYCKPCGRWFYIDALSATPGVHHCPVCETPSRRAVDRTPVSKGV